MATYTGTGKKNSDYVGTLTVTEYSQDIEANNTTLRFSLIMENNNYNYYTTGWTTTAYISVNGSVIKSVPASALSSGMSPSSSAQYHYMNIVTDFEYTVQHDDDGTKSIVVSAVINSPYGKATNSGVYVGGGTINIAGGTYTITAIPRGSAITTLDDPMTIGTASTIGITRYSNSFTHSLAWTCLSSSGTLLTKSTASSVGFTPPTSLYSEMPDTTSATVTFTITTYSGDDVIQTRTYTTTAEIPSTEKPSTPTVTVTPVNTNAWLTTKGYYVAGYTKAQFASSSTAPTGTTIAGYTISGAESGSGTPWQTSIPTAGGAKVYYVKSYDSRGRVSAKRAVTVTWQSYSFPALTTFKAERGTYSGGSWTSSPTGAHIRVQAIGATTLSGNTGTISVSISGQTVTSHSGNYWIFSGTSTTSEYTIVGVITDSLGNSSTYSLAVSTIAVPVNFNFNLPGVSFGEMATDANVVNIASGWSLIVGGYPVKVTNQLKATWTIDTSGPSFTTDVSYADMYTAYNAGKELLCDVVVSGFTIYNVPLYRVYGTGVARFIINICVYYSSAYHLICAELYTNGSRINITTL